MRKGKRSPQNPDLFPFQNVCGECGPHTPDRVNECRRYFSVTEAAPLSLGRVPIGADNTGHENGHDGLSKFHWRIIIIVDIDALTSIKFKHYLLTPR